MIRSLPYAARRARQTLTSFDNGGRLLVDIARHAITSRPTDLVFRIDDSYRMAVPNSAGARLPVYELFVDDTYRLGWFASGLGDAPVALDIGAHVGSFAVAFARTFPKGQVEAYEASPTTAEYLRRNVEINDLGGRVHAHNEAVSDAAGELVIVDNGAASVHNGVLHLADGGATIKVPCVSMVTALASAGRPVDVVKIDIEGAEYDMILASKPEDWATVRRVVMEYHPLPGRVWEDLETFFSAAGLSVVDRDQIAPNLGMAWLSRDTLA